MKKFVQIILVFSISVPPIFAQNLVPNYSLEDYSSCPMGPGELSNATGWATPDSATPDYYNACYTSFFPMMPSMDVPDNIQGYQHAHTGDAYAGIICYDAMGSYWREYMRIQLTTPLTAGTEYKVRFWWSLADKSPYSVEQIGILITDEYINYFGGGQNYTSALPYTPTVATSGSQLADTSNWVLHEECFIAQGGEEWIYVGNFRDENDVNFVDTGVACDIMVTAGCFAYYYIDDVSVEEGSCDPITCDLTASIDATDPSCGDPNGSATAIAGQGTSPYFYVWSNSESTETITGLSDGNYSVTITDNDGCTAEASVTLSGTDGPTVNTSGVIISDANCNMNDGSITGISVSGGSSPTSYTWENSSGTQVGTSLDLINVPSGTYSLTVTDDNGCEEYAGPFTINDIGGPDIDDVSIVIVDASCGQANGSISGIIVSAGTPPYSFAWFNALSSQVGSALGLNNVGGGDYILEVTDDNGCIVQSGPYTIDDIPGPALDHYTVDVSCYGGSDGEIYVNVSGGTAPFTYNWSNGDDTQNLFGVDAGIYALTVTDANGCEAYLQATISEPAPIYASADSDVVICYGQTTDINASASGGSSPYSFYWGNGTVFSPGGSTLSVSPDNDTVFFVFAVDANGCYSDTVTVNVTVSPEMFLDLDVENVNCHGVCDGEAVATVSGGIGPYDYSWDSDNNTLPNLCAGSYALTVTDQYACDIETAFQVTEPDTLVGTIYSENPLCSGSSDGSAWVYAAGGVPPYSYQWTLGQQDDTASNLPAGLHEVSVTDANGCQMVLSAYLTDPDDIIISGVGNRQICIGGTASYSTAVTGGTPPYMFHWYGPDGYEWFGNEMNVSPDETSVYMLAVTDAHDCTKSASMTVNVYPELNILNFYTANDSVCKGESTTLEFEISGGNGGPYEVVLNGNNIITSPYIFTPSYSGWYKIKVRDACETPPVYDSLYITVLDLPVNNFVSDIHAACPPAMVRFNALEPHDNYSYEWVFGDDAFAYGNEVNHVYGNSGYFDVTLLVIDQYGCEKRKTKTKMIHVYPKPDVDFYTKPNEVNILNPRVVFYPVVSDTDSIYWYFGDGDSTMSSMWNPVHAYDGVGNYEIEMIGVNQYNCRDTAEKIIKVKDYFSFYAPTAFTPNYDGKNDCFSVCGTGIDPNEFSLRIYNRWGELVFVTTTFDESDGCDACGDGAWDGTMQGDVLKGDKLLSSGFYPWICVYKDDFGVEYQEEGVVRLVR